MSEPPNEKQMARLLIGLTEGRLSDPQRQELRDLVQGDAACRADYIDYMTMHAMLEFRHGRIGAEPDGPETQSRLIESFAAQTSPAEGCDAAFPEPLLFESHHSKQNSEIGTKQVFALLGYVAGKALRKHAVVLSGFAAVLVLGVILLPVFREVGDAPAAHEWVVDDPPVVPQVDEPEETPPPVAPMVVATLTADHDAQWAQGVLAPGSPLRAGQRLTLTQGFAEITTRRGAVAILEAPATIELFDSLNALWLYAGKLVGDVPPEATGFTVYTPTAQVVDHGTLFGVEVEKDGSTRAAVFEGEVELFELGKQFGSPDRSVRLTSGWASGVTERGLLLPEPRPISAEDHGRFVRLIDDTASPDFAYRRSVLSQGPLLYWGFDERQDRTQNLAGRDAFDGQSIGQVQYTQGVFGSALKLTGKDETRGGVAAVERVVLASTEAYTLEAWVHAESHHWGAMINLAVVDRDLKRRPADFAVFELLNREEERDEKVRIRADRLIRFTHRSPPSSLHTKGSNLFNQSVYSTGRWLHLVAVKDSGTMKLYLDGELAGQQTVQSLSENDVSLDFTVGASAMIRVPSQALYKADFRPFHGLIDEVALYNTALSAGTIRRHYSLGQAAITP
ncbi:MAG: LamG-like jellyroll fold domain-containing protein [Planctomycetota bacterium]